MVADNVTPIGARLGSEKLYADARAPDTDDDARPAPPPTPPPKPPKPPKPSVVTTKTPPPPARDRRRSALEWIATVCELLGVAVVAFGAWQLAPWLGIIIAGLAFIAVGAALSPSLAAARSRRRKGGTTG